MPETTARLRYFQVSPTKARQVLGLIRGLDVASARDLLESSERGFSRDLVKLLDSAVANAEHNDNLPGDELYVARAHADEGPTARRWRTRARGRGVRIRKRTSHVTIVLARYPEDELLARRRREETVGGTRRRPERRRQRRTEDHGHEHEPDEEHLEPEADEATFAELPADDATTADEGARAPSPTARARKASAKSTAKKASAKKAAKTATAKRATAAKTVKKATAKKAAAEKATAEKATAEKPTAKKAMPRKRGAQ